MRNYPGFIDNFKVVTAPPLQVYFDNNNFGNTMLHHILVLVLFGVRVLKARTTGMPSVFPITCRKFRSVEKKTCD